MASRKNAAVATKTRKQIRNEDSSVKPEPMTAQDDTLTENLTVGFLKSLGLPHTNIAGSYHSSVVPNVAGDVLDDDEPTQSTRWCEFGLGGVTFGFGHLEGDDPFEGAAGTDTIEVKIVSIKPNVRARRAAARAAAQLPN